MTSKCAGCSAAKRTYATAIAFRRDENVLPALARACSNASANCAKHNVDVVNIKGCEMMIRSNIAKELRKAWSASAPLTVTALLMFAALIASIAGILLDHRVITGVPAWLK